MRVLSEDHLKARACLAAGSFLIDPRYQFPQQKYEDQLRERCRICWKLREFFPSWVHTYIEQWKANKEPAVTREEEDFA